MAVEDGVKSKNCKLTYNNCCVAGHLMLAIEAGGYPSPDGIRIVTC
jgi:hypothetical protein